MISVCMTSYNGDKYIKYQIDSILKQLESDDQLIISDDGSTDNTLDIINSYNDNRILLLSHTSLNISETSHSEAHYKVTANFENALNHAIGEYIFLSDQDDIWMENKIARVLPYLREKSVVVSNFSYMDSSNHVTKDIVFNSCPIKGFLYNIFRQPFYGCCMAFPKALLKSALPFPKNLIMHDNWLGLLAQALGYKIIFISEPLIQYRRHDNNVSPIKSCNPLFFKLKYRAKLLGQLLSRASKNIHINTLQLI